MVGDNEYAIGEGVVLSNSPDVKVVWNIQYGDADIFLDLDDH